MPLEMFSPEPLAFAAGGRELKAHCGSLRRVARLQAAFARNPPPPAIPVDFSEMPAAIAGPLAQQHARVAAEKSREWPPDCSSEEGLRAILADERLQKALLKEALEPGWPGMTADDADALLDHVSAIQLKLIVYKFFGLLEGEQEDPKALPAALKAAGARAPAQPADAPDGGGAPTGTPSTSTA